MALKDLVRRAARGLGYEITRKAPEIGEPINLLDLAVRASLRHVDPFLVIEIGAYDGMMADPVRLIILRYELPALLVEPMPDAFRRLRKNYEGRPGVRFENCAIDRQDGSRDLYWVDVDEEIAGRIRRHGFDPEHVRGKSSFDRNNILALRPYVPDIADRIRVRRVETLSLRSLFEKHRIDSVGLLQIDTEGFDFEVIRMLLETALRPAVINYERINLSRNDQAECRRLLDREGYRFFNTGTDTLAVRD